WGGGGSGGEWSGSERGSAAMEVEVEKREERDGKRLGRHWRSLELYAMLEEEEEPEVLPAPSMISAEFSREDNSYIAATTIGRELEAPDVTPE
ncbi:hypothetical protein A2U01_0042056, partial [Trifolium medium]|nr:hypothetical protein [Trifolium medium]